MAVFYNILDAVSWALPKRTYEKIRIGAFLLQKNHVEYILTQYCPLAGNITGEEDGPAVTAEPAGGSRSGETAGKRDFLGDFPREQERKSFESGTGDPPGRHQRRGLSKL